MNDNTTLDISIEDIPTANLEEETRDYLKECGMTDEEIDKLRDLFM